jgi:hypothetical protein
MFLDDLTKISQLPQPSLGLLPAIHDASVEDVEAVPETPAGNAGKVYRNTALTALALPALARWPAQAVAPGETFGCDGRLFFKAVQRLVRAVGETSYYPAAFERTLYTIHLTPRQLPLGANFQLSRQFDFRLVANTSNAVWNVVFEVGQRTTQTTPAPTGPNLLDYAWRTPLLEQQIVLTDVASQHALGVSLVNTATGYTASRLIYDRAEAVTDADALPTTSDFALRVRLTAFDTQNSIADPRGYVAYVAGPLPQG